MIIILIAFVLLILFFLLYLVGGIGKQSLAEPSYALPIEKHTTPLDIIMQAKLDKHPGESCLMLLQNNVDAFAMRAITAFEAGRSLDLQYYLWHDDLTGKLLGSEILAAAERGVRVRLLIDDMNVRNNSLLLRALNAHRNINVRLFNPICIRRNRLMRIAEMLLSLFSINRRMHNKAWIVDGRIAIVGGRNIGDEYFDAAAKRNFFDADLFVGGVAVNDAVAIFDNFWNSQVAVPLEVFFHQQSDKFADHLNKMDTVKASQAAKPYLQTLLETPSVNALFDGNWEIHWTKNVFILSDPPEKILNQRQSEWLFAKVKPILSEVKEKINLISPYFVPGKIGMRALLAACKKNIDISILTNSLAATDVLLVHGGYQHYRKQLLMMGIHLYELKPFGKTERTLLGSKGASLHTKACLIDNRIGFIGSFNLDQRSAMLNTEMGVLFEEIALTKVLQNAFIIHSSTLYSYKLLLIEDKIRWQDISEEEVACFWDDEPQTRWWQRVVAKIISYLPLDSQL